MKKFLSVIFAFVMCFTVAVSADGKITLDLPLIPDDAVVIDGENTEWPWKSAANVTLTKENTGTWADMDSEEHILAVDTYIMWSEKGIYVYADVTDNDPVFNGANDCFEISFNPGGLIPKEDKLQGMFFMFWPSDGEGNVKCTRHNIDEDSLSGIDAHDVETKYKPTDKGWTIEALIPWHYICDENREVYINRRLTDNLLADFERKEGEFLTATICRLNGDEEWQYCAVYRTCTDNYGGNFNTDSYNVVLNLGATAIAPESETAPAQTDSSPDNSSDSSFPSFIIIAAVSAAVIVIAVFTVIRIKKSKKK